MNSNSNNAGGNTITDGNGLHVPGTLMVKPATTDKDENFKHNVKN